MDEYYMRRAIQLARRGAGFTSPNPMVGAVIVKDDEIIGEGFHAAYGENHAEIQALEEAGAQAEGADLYVTLEPCSHQGKTPPCVLSIIESGIDRVFIANEDPNPRVSGSGCEELINSGLEVKTGVLAAEASRLNEAFLKYMKDNRPFFVQKTAQTLDGYLASSRGDSKWITGEMARKYGHRLRHELDAVLVGSNTLKKDNPRLTVRAVSDPKSQPLRVVLAGDSDISKQANLFQSGEKVLIFARDEVAAELKVRFAACDRTEIVEVRCDKNEFLDLDEVAEDLANREIMSVLIEGGGRVNYSFLQSGLTDKFYFFLAPKLLGGNDGVAAFSGKAVNLISDTEKVQIEEIKMLGEDLMITAYPGKENSRENRTG